MKVSGLSGIGVGLQRSWPIGSSLSSWQGAVRISAGVDLGEAAVVADRRADAVEPGALVGAARRGERRAGQLLGIEPIGAALRRVAPDRQRAGNGLGREAVAEAGQVGRLVAGVGLDRLDNRHRGSPMRTAEDSDLEV